MRKRVSMPRWLALLLGALSGTAVLDRLLVPSVRWFIRQRTKEVLAEINTRLPIEIRPFQRTKRHVLINRLQYDPKVQQAAAEHAQATGMPREVVDELVERYAREIVPAFNAYFYFRIGYWLARRLAQALYRVRLGYTDESGLQSIPRDATVIFVMNHRSNMDYVLVAYLAASHAALSYAVGEWARIWPLQSLVRAMGAYFVRRNSRDALYRRVLERYVSMATAAGVTQAVYPEGGLSRDGRLRAPRLGLIDYMLRGFDPDERDLVFVPVGINYDRVLEDRTLLLEALPAEQRPPAAPAVRTTLGFIARNVRLLIRDEWHRFGYACVNFGTPISMRQYIADHQIDLHSLDRDARFAEVQEFGEALMQAVGSIVPVVPVAVVATVLVRQPEQPISLLELKARAQTLIIELEAHGAQVYIPRSDRDYAIGVGLRMLTLRRLVENHGGLYRVRPHEIGVLRYYANSIAHLIGDTSS